MIRLAVTDVAPGVRQLTIRSVVSIHMYLLETADGVVAFDTGIKGSAPEILAAAGGALPRLSSATATWTTAAARRSLEPRSIAIRARSSMPKATAVRTTSTGIWFRRPARACRSFTPRGTEARSDRRDRCRGREGRQLSRGRRAGTCPRADRSLPALGPAATRARRHLHDRHQNLRGRPHAHTPPSIQLGQRPRSGGCREAARPRCNESVRTGHGRHLVGDVDPQLEAASTATWPDVVERRETGRTPLRRRGYLHRGLMLARRLCEHVFV